MKTSGIFLTFFLPSLILLMNIFGCANPLPPSGGPRDTIPPKIIEYFPENGRTNYREKYVKIKFDKYMDKNSVQENTTIIPSLNTEFDWSGKQLKIEFLEQPDENTTYSISLGSEIKDWKGNKPDESFSIIFSTGNNIDSGKITGKLTTNNPAGASVLLYKLPNDSNEFRIFDITTEKPNYYIQIGSSGLFEIKALKDGFYRLIAIRDKYKNRIYDDGDDDFGAYFEDIYIKQDSVVDVKIKLGPPIDNLGPILYDAIPVSNNIIELIFSEPLDSNYLSPNAVSIHRLEDNNQLDEISPFSIIFSTESNFKLMLFLSENLDTSYNYLVKCNLNSDIALRDTIGNIIRDTANSVVFTPATKEVKIIPSLISASLQDSSVNVYPKSEFEFVFNLPLQKRDYNNLFKLINLTDNSSEKSEVFFKTDNIITIKPVKKLSSDCWYELSLQSDSIFSFNNMKMSVSTFSYKFKTADIRNHSGISGNLKTNYRCKGEFFVIIKNTITKKIEITKTNKFLEWNFDDLPPGDYEFEVFCDEDGNGRYSFGYAKEFRFSERFFIPKDKITLKSRWKLENYQLELNYK